MDSNNFMKLNQACKDCVKNKNKLVLELNNNASVKECSAVLTKKYMQLRKKIKIHDENGNMHNFIFIILSSKQ
jgi:hypothetical protein